MDPWKVLRLQPGASPAEIKSAYRARMMECHPDRGGSEEEAKRVNRAFELLTRVDVAPAPAPWAPPPVWQQVVVIYGNVYTSGNNSTAGTDWGFSTWI